MRIAVIGSGVSGLSCAWLLANNGVNVTLLEAADRPGGHSNTVSLDIGGKPVAVDTGFVVYNQATYPNLTAMFQHLNVATDATDMSFAVSAADGLEYAGHGLNGLFAQRRNLLRPGFWRMLKDIRQFYAHATELDVPPETTLFDLLSGYSSHFANYHLLPMAAAIWSTDVAQVGNMQARSFIDFFHNHGLLQLRDRPPWYTVRGGSIAYVSKLLTAPGLKLALNARISGIERTDGMVKIDINGDVQHYDQVVLATHADQALRLLEEPSVQEKLVLENFSYSSSKAYLHADAKLMPVNRRAWASWNYLDRGADGLCVTYWMNSLQHLATEKQIFVTLNPTGIPEQSFAEFDYEHPILNNATASARERLWDLQGTQQTWFCGAYFGHGFHEDALQSGLAVAEEISGKSRPWRLSEPDSRIIRKRRRQYRDAA